MPSSPAAPAAGRRGRPGYDLADILRISVQTFNEHGYDATSMSVLGERLGLSKSAIYHHVPSKEELLRLALETALGQLEGVLAEAQSPDLRSDERLEVLLRGAVGALTRNTAEVTLLLRVRGNSPVEREALERRRAFDASVTEILTVAAADGYVRADIPPRLATRLIFGMVNSIVEWYRPERASDPEAVADAVLAIVMNGVRS